MQWLVVTDLDGTLLDDTYPTAEAARAVDEIQASPCGVRVALASSKTLSEMKHIATHTTNTPFLIFENGGGVAWPRHALLRNGQFGAAEYEVTLFARPYEDVCVSLGELKATGFSFLGFSELSHEQICDLTGLGIEEARRAQERLTGEPLQWLDRPDRLPDFLQALGARGLSAQWGGRFLHVSSRVNKVLALKYLCGQIRYETGVRPRILACGDAPNDLDMIDRADYALLFPDRDGHYLRSFENTVAHAPLAGPDHWLSGVRKIVDAHG